MGSWCWERVAHLLRQAGHDVTAIDLPGHGTTPVGEITLHAYTGADIHSLDSGHCPFLTQPRELTELPIRAAGNTSTPP